MAFVKLTSGTFRPDPKPEPKEKKKKTRISPMSEKRTEQNKIYLIRRPLFLATNTDCKINSEDCTKKTKDVHHTYSGKNRNKYFLDETTWIAICRNCHNWIHDNPKQARKIGYLK